MKKILPEITALSFLLLYLLWGLLELRALQINGWDYGIFQQTLFDVSSGAGFNPFNTVRGIFIFNEHFYPVLIPLSYLTQLLGYPESAPFFIEWLSVAIAVVFAMHVTRDQSLAARLMIVVSLIFVRSILSALLFPVHTDTWTLLPHMLIIYGVAKERYRLVFFSAFSLVFFKETYAFGIVGLSGFYLFRKDWKRFLPLFALGLFFVAMELGPRKALMGDGNYYAQSYARTILTQPIETFKIMFKTFTSGSFIKVFLPYLIPVFFLLRFGTPLAKKLLFAGSCYLAPLIAIHLIIERFYFHHASQNGIILSSVLIFSGFFHEISKERKKILLLMAIPFIAVSTSSYSKLFQPIVKTITNQVPYDSESIEFFQSVRTKIDEVMAPNETIFATGALTVRLLAPRRLIYHPSSTVTPKVYHLIALERAPYGDLWPIGDEKVQKMIKDCRTYATEIYFENQYAFVARGEFPSECFE